MNSGMDHMKSDQYRGPEFSPAEGIGIPGTIDAPVAPQAPVVTEAQSVEETLVKTEREERLEALMRDVKSFIRNIDINSL